MSGRPPGHLPARSETPPARISAAYAGAGSREPTLVQRVLLLAAAVFGLFGVDAEFSRRMVLAAALTGAAFCLFALLLAGALRRLRRAGERVTHRGTRRRPPARPALDGAYVPGAVAQPGHPRPYPADRPGTGPMPAIPGPGPKPAMPGTGSPTPAMPGTGPMPAVRETRLPEPPAFGKSTAGQAPWLLPGQTAPSGLAADAARLGDLEVRAASVVGAAHRCEEPAEARQDAYALGRTEDGQYLIVAVADGVSSSRHSDLGARVAVSTSVRELRTMLASGGIAAIDAQHLYKAVAGEMVGTGRSRRVEDRDVCTILITVAIPARPRPDGSRGIWASWIGDVSMWLLRNDQFYRFTGQDKTGLDRNKLNAVLPFSPDQVESDMFELEPGDRVAVMTDGLSDSLTEIPSVSRFFAGQWSGPPPHPAAFLHGLCYDAPGQTDDRTAVIVWTGTGKPPARGRG